MVRRKTITLALPRGEVRAYDMMGNELPMDKSQLTYGRQPVYLEGGPGLSVGSLKAAIASGVIRDVEDTTPPSISISDGPRGTTPMTSARVRWIAIDDAAVPIVGVPSDAIQYSYRLLGRDAQWSAWTAKTREDYEGLLPRDYRFEVKAKDLSDNVSPTVARQFTVEARR